MTKEVWKVHLSRLLGQLFDNPGMSILVRPFQMLAIILDQVATRASELNDPKMNALMCRLGLYAISNPDDPEYNPKLTNKIIEKGS